LGALKLWLLAMGAGLMAGSADAAGPLSGNFHAPPEQVRRDFKISPLAPPAMAFVPFRQSGMFAETNVAPNMRIGVGMFGSRSGEGAAFELNSGPRAKPKRKLGLSFSWRF
jgi:hypothetical protein